MYDAVVVGSGPNGLAAAVELARNGRSVVVLEAEDTVGGGARSAELTLPGFVHDVGSAIHPLGYVSPFFSTLPLEEHGLEWVHPPAPLAHPFDEGTATVLERSVEETGRTLGSDAEAYQSLMQPIARDFDRIVGSLLGPPRLPRHPVALAGFGLRALRSARGLAEGLFAGEKAKVLFDVTPRQLLKIAGAHFTGRYRRALERYRYGPGVFKVDFALDNPIPWRAEECLRAGTVHIGGTLDEISLREATVSRGEHPERPFVLLAQQSLFDASRAPEGKHTVWAYCHVPNGSTFDMTEKIEAQIERFAPGFKDRILAKSTMGPADLQRINANHVGGDINGGIMDFRQLFTRPTARLTPYSTPAKGLYICSSSTPPGGGVHGMCGYFAARAALVTTLR